MPLRLALSLLVLSVLAPRACAQQVQRLLDTLSVHSDPTWGSVVSLDLQDMPCYGLKFGHGKATVETQDKVGGADAAHGGAHASNADTGALILKFCNLGFRCHFGSVQAVGWAIDPGDDDLISLSLPSNISPS
jgi:hypothetical protein